MADYYVANAPTGDDANNGTTMLTPWETVGKVNGESFASGDSINFNKGDAWRDATLTQPAAGASGNVITVGVYGTGADPVLNGADLKTDATDWRGYQHSDDFETGDFSKWDTQNTTGSNTVTVIAGAARGASSYGMRSTFDGTNNVCNTNVALGAAASDITITFYIKLSSDFSLSATFANQAIHMFCLDNGTNVASLELRQNAEGSFLVWGELVSPWTAVSQAISLNTWHKVEFRYVVDGAAGGVSVSVDDAAATEDFTKDTSGDTIGQYFVGGYNYGTAYIDAGSVDFDDISVTVADAVNTDAYRSKTTTGWAAATSKGVLIQDGLHLEPNVTSVASLTEGQYYLDGSDYVWVYPAGGGSPADYTTEQAARNYCLDVNGKDYVTYEDIDFRNPVVTCAVGSVPAEDLTFDGCGFANAYWDGIALTGAAYDTITLTGCSFREIRRYHVQITGTDTANKNTLIATGNSFVMDGEGWTCKAATESATVTALRLTNAHDSVITYNTFTFLNFIDDSGVFDDVTGASNVVWSSGGDNFTFQRNVITGGRHGIQVTDTIGADLQYNDFSKTRDDAIWMYTGSSGTLTVAYNGISDTGDDGVSIESPTDFYNNVIVRVSDSGITLFAGGAASNIKNNIIMDWGEATDDTNEGMKAIYRQAAATIDYNYYYRAAGSGNDWHDNGTDRNFAGWQGQGYDTNGDETDPLMVDPANDDFTLQATSPCINAGADVGLTTDRVGNLIKGTPDIGAYEYQTTAGAGEPSLGTGLGLKLDIGL